MDSTTGRRYIFVKTPLPWAEAQADAQSRGGNLATITSQHEQDFIASHLLPSESYYIGASDAAQEGNWQWVTGEPWGYSNWNYGEPNDWESAEDAAMICGYLEGRWNDVRSVYAGAYIIEIDSIFPPMPSDISFGTDKGMCLTLTPTVFWHAWIDSGLVQERVEITVLAIVDSLWSPIWSSGEVFSSDTSLTYDGPPLSDDADYQLQIRLHDGQKWGGTQQVGFHVHLPRVLTVPEPYAMHEAIRESLTGDSILVSPGIHTINRIPVFSSVTILAVNGPDETFLRLNDDSAYFFRFYKTRHVVVDGFSIIADTAASAFVLNSATVTFRNLRVSDCAFGASCINGGTDTSRIIVSRSIFSRITGGVVTNPGGTILFENNTVYGIDSNAVAGYLQPSRFENNIFAECKGWAIFGNVDSLDEQYNCFWHNGLNRRAPEGERPISDSSFEADPMLSSPSLQVFDLTPESPCIDAGNPDLTFNDPDGSRNDIGFSPYAPLTMSLSNLLIDGYPRNRHAINLPPTFSWAYADDSDAQQQHKIQIQISSDIDWNIVDVWDSGELSLTATTLIPPIANLQRGPGYQLRMRVSDGSVWSAWHYTWFRINRPPAKPLLNAPLDRFVLTTSGAKFSTKGVIDPDADPLQYQFQFFSDSARTQEYLTVMADTDDGPGTAAVTVAIDLAENTIGAWRARAWDGFQYSDWSEPRIFAIDRIHEAPLPATLIYPIDEHRPVASTKPTFVWTSGGDPDPFQALTYRWQISSVPSFLLYSDSILTETTLVITQSLAMNKVWYWRVYAIDPDGLQVVSTSGSFRTYIPGDINGSGNVDIGDLSVFIDYMYITAAPLEEPLLGDVNGDCAVDIVDLTRLIDHLFISMQPLAEACTANPGSEPEW